MNAAAPLPILPAAEIPPGPYPLLPVAPHRRDGPDPAVERGTRAVYRINVLGEMASGIAHDFRNLLAVLQSALTLAERHLGDPEAARRFLASARQGIERGTDLTARLLAVARPHGPGAHLEPVAALLREAVPFLRYAAGPRIRLSLDLGDDLPDCRADRGQLNAALLNLVVNARDAMPEGGAIGIEAAAAAPPFPAPGAGRKNWLRVSVSDDGAGMSGETLERIFERWFTTKGDGGTGLGLPQVAGFLERIGGSVKVRSRPGQGTRVELYFPVEGETPEADLSRQIDRWTDEGGFPGHA